MIVSQINHGKANDFNNGYSREIPYNAEYIARLPTEENHISVLSASRPPLSNLWLPLVIIIIIIISFTYYYYY